MDIADEAEYAQLVAEFNAERDVEYGEIVEGAPDLRKELGRETARGNAPYAEVEESEADLERSAARHWQPSRTPPSPRRPAPTPSRRHSSSR